MWRSPNVSHRRTRLMETFGRYQILRRIAVGGMAEIYLAQSASIDGFEKTVVIKKIRPDLSSDDQFFSMFIDEARISITFSHPNIVQVFDFGKVEDSYFLAMEFVSGCDSGALLELSDVSGTGMDPEVALFIIEEALRGLDYAHNKRSKSDEPLHLVHRDISPANILVSIAGAVKVGDFGIAQAKGTTANISEGSILGKVAYMSPEQARGEVLDCRSDLFSCALVLWEMLVGRAAYGSTITSASIANIMEGRVRAPSEVNPALSPEIDRLVMKALAPKPEDRYPTARAFGEALHAYKIQHHPNASSYRLQSFLQQHQDELRHEADTQGKKTPQTPACPQPPAPQVDLGETARLDALPSLGFEWTSQLVREVDSFKRHPSLWTLVQMGDLCVSTMYRQAATAFFRFAAVKFAQGGFLAPCLLCCNRMLNLSKDENLCQDITRYPSIEGQSDEAIRTLLFGARSPVDELLKELLEETQVRLGHKGAGTPILSQLSGASFLEFAEKAKLNHFSEGESIIRQAEPGNTMFLVAKGRVAGSRHQQCGREGLSFVAHVGGFFLARTASLPVRHAAQTSKRSSMSTFSKSTRICTRRVTLDTTDANDILLGFYKSRIVDTLLATSPIFGMLATEDRRALINKFKLRVFQPGENIILEKERSDQIYLLKNGQAEVFTDKDGVRTQLSLLGPGTIFGEVAALRGIARTASVAARSSVETLELSRSDFHSVLEHKPVLKAKVLDVIAERTRENMNKLVGGMSWKPS